MIIRTIVIALVGLLAVHSGDSNETESWCESVCPTPKVDLLSACPTIPPCPEPQCPPFPEIPPCPTPHCPAPVVNVTCPEPLHSPPQPPASCAPCPRCAPPPPVPTCPACPACPAPSVKVSPKSLPEGYIHLPGAGSYRFYTDELTWMEANQTCSRDGGYLAIPKTSVQLNALLYIMESTKTSKAFIGLHDFYHEGVYRTALGQQMNNFQYSLWGPGEPDGGSKKNAIYLKKNGHIYDNFNNNLLPFICELRNDRSKH